MLPANSNVHIFGRMIEKKQGHKNNLHLHVIGWINNPSAFKTWKKRKGIFDFAGSHFLGRLNAHCCVLKITKDKGIEKRKRQKTKDKRNKNNKNKKIKDF